ncbi:MAG TPA: LysR substrate-binding domain-containing protein [Albitalea sp.]|uniref:LysR family transcriptional regulator n=1 Tax=Piscinibacter sp. TaxID=1903157 RepID=UPI002ED385E2
MKQLQGLLAFVEAATTGSLTAAADRLDVTPAAVSKSLARLEERLGVRLLNRSTRRLGLTAEGAGFLAKARLALRALDDAVADVSQAARTPAGRVRISVGAAFGRRWVLPALPALTARYPELAIELDLDNRPVDLVAEGYDIGIRGGFIEDSSLVARRICRLPLALVASPAYLKQAGVPVSVDELAQHRCAVVRFAGSTPSPWRFVRAGGRRVEFMPEAPLSVSDPEAVLDLALAHAGIVQAGLQHALPYLRSGRLKLVMSGQHDPGDREFVLHYPHRQFLAPRVRVVVEALLAHFKELGDLHLMPADVAQYAAASAQPASRRRKTSRSGSEAAGAKA